MPTVKNSYYYCKYRKLFQASKTFEKLLIGRRVKISIAVAHIIVLIYLVLTQCRIIHKRKDIRKLLECVGSIYTFIREAVNI